MPFSQDNVRSAQDIISQFGGVEKFQKRMSTLAGDFRSEANSGGHKELNVRRLHEGSAVLELVAQVVAAAADPVQNGIIPEVARNLFEPPTMQQEEQSGSRADALRRRVVFVSSTLQQAVDILKMERKQMLQKKREGEGSLEEIAEAQAYSDVDRRNVVSVHNWVLAAAADYAAEEGLTYTSEGIDAQGRRRGQKNSGNGPEQAA